MSLPGHETTGDPPVAGKPGMQTASCEFSGGLDLPPVIDFQPPYCAHFAILSRPPQRSGEAPKGMQCMLKAPDESWKRYSYSK